MTVKMTMEEYEELKAKERLAEQLIEKIKDCARRDTNNHVVGVNFEKFYWLHMSVDK